MGLRLRTRGRGGREGRCRANPQQHSPRAEWGAPSLELRAERRAGAGAGAQRRRSAPAPARVPPPPGPKPWSQITAHERSSSRSRCWSRTWTPRRPSRYGKGGAARLGDGQGTRPWNLNPCLAPQPGTAPLLGRTRPIYEGRVLHPLPQRRSQVSPSVRVPVLGVSESIVHSLPCLVDTTPPPLATLRPLTLSQPPESTGWVSALT